MSKIAYNACYGGFSLSWKAVLRLQELGQPDAEKEVKRAYNDDLREISRHDPLLVQVIEELGTAANGGAAKLELRELPTGAEYRIDEYDGYESVCTKEDYKWEVAP